MSAQKRLRRERAIERAERWLSEIEKMLSDGVDDERRDYLKDKKHKTEAMIKNTKRKLL